MRQLRSRARNKVVWGQVEQKSLEVLSRLLQGVVVCWGCPGLVVASNLGQRLDLRLRKPCWRVCLWLDQRQIAKRSRWKVGWILYQSVLELCSKLPHWRNIAIWESRCWWDFWVTNQLLRVQQWQRRYRLGVWFVNRDSKVDGRKGWKMLIQKKPHRECPALTILASTPGTAQTTSQYETFSIPKTHTDGRHD